MFFPLLPSFLYFFSSSFSFCGLVLLKRDLSFFALRTSLRSPIPPPLSIQLRCPGTPPPPCERTQYVALTEGWLVSGERGGDCLDVGEINIPPKNCQQEGLCRMESWPGRDPAEPGLEAGGGTGGCSPFGVTCSSQMPAPECTRGPDCAGATNTERSQLVGG